ncbi:MAG: hypothetical protein JWO38_2195 [Gemmataceae bacterium]|nr:hypothetical protein [Gemmataceae bacterium]
MNTDPFAARTGAPSEGFSVGSSETSPALILSQAAARAGAEFPVLQDFRPLTESIEWELGQLYLQEHGSAAFLGDAEPVPYLVNNNGNLSVAAAEVFFASLEEAERAGTLEPEVFALELGIGVGLFARFFLDAFRALCGRRGKDYYHRLCYVAADHSEAMLADIERHGIFSNHPGRTRLRRVDARCPERELARDPLFGGLAPRPFRAVFLNYLLDCLPATVRELQVRTRLTADDYRPALPTDLARLASSLDPADRRQLLEAYDLRAVDYAYRPVDPALVPYGDFAVRRARATGLPGTVVSHGTLDCLERLLGLLRDGGFILINDYGPATETDADEFQHDRYSHATFVGINFPLLRAYFAGERRARWVEPPDEQRAGTRAYLLGHQLGPETVGCFQDRLGKAGRDWLREPEERARQHARQEHFEEALAAYRQALERQPYNWALMEEVAHFLTVDLRDAAAGAEMARAALACNPSCSANLWNTLGESLLAVGQREEARQAYVRALEVNAADVRARCNLAAVHTKSGQDDLALQRIAEGLALDRAGGFRERLLAHQAEVLDQLRQQHQQRARRLANRIHPRAASPPPKTRRETAGDRSPPLRGGLRSSGDRQAIDTGKAGGVDVCDHRPHHLFQTSVLS